MQTVAVIGSGQMGTGIAQTIAQHGMKLILADIDLERAQAGKAGIEAGAGQDCRARKDGRGRSGSCSGADHTGR